MPQVFPDVLKYAVFRQSAIKWTVIFLLFDKFLVILKSINKIEIQFARTFFMVDRQIVDSLVVIFFTRPTSARHFFNLNSLMLAMLSRIPRKVAPSGSVGDMPG